MNTFQRTFSLSEPEGDTHVPIGTIGYFNAFNRHAVYETVIDEFEKSGISQATLARRMGKKPEIICRLMSGPGNWTLDTVSTLLFAISGAQPKYSIDYPLQAPPRNYRWPEWYHIEDYIERGDDHDLDVTSDSSSNKISLTFEANA